MVAQDVTVHVDPKAQSMTWRQLIEWADKRIEEGLSNIDTLLDSQIMISTGRREPYIIPVRSIADTDDPVVLEI